MISLILPCGAFFCRFVYCFISGLKYVSKSSFVPLSLPASHAGPCSFSGVGIKVGAGTTVGVTVGVLVGCTVTSGCTVSAAGLVITGAGCVFAGSTSVPVAAVVIGCFSFFVTFTAQMYFFFWIRATIFVVPTCFPHTIPFLFTVAIFLFRELHITFLFVFFIESFFFSPTRSTIFLQLNAGLFFADTPIVEMLVTNIPAIRQRDSAFLILHCFFIANPPIHPSFS